MDAIAVQIQEMIRELSYNDSFKVLKMMKPTASDEVVEAVVETKGQAGNKYAIIEYLAGREAVNKILRGRN